MLRVGVVTLFPNLVSDVFQHGVTARARERALWDLGTFNPRDFAHPPHRAVDDRPYGGGPGMVMLHEPLKKSISLANQWTEGADGRTRTPCPTILLSPSGSRFDQRRARALATLDRFTLVCGRYEGIDQRTIDSEITEQISVGDYVLSGGELAAAIVIDAVVRLLPGALNDSQSSIEESFSFGLLDHPHYTRPETLADGRTVPRELLSGNHAAIARFRREQALTQTAKLRPDLLERISHLSQADIDFLRSIGYTGVLSSSCEKK
jgi:tRNA (guanine37-N1)-methyltransferase